MSIFNCSTSHFLLMVGCYHCIHVVIRVLRFQPQSVSCFNSSYCSFGRIILQSTDQSCTPVKSASLPASADAQRKTKVSPGHGIVGRCVYRLHSNSRCSTRFTVPQQQPPRMDEALSFISKDTKHCPSGIQEIFYFLWCRACGQRRMLVNWKVLE